MPLAKLEAFEKSAVSLAAFAKAMAHPARIRILQYLSGKGEVPCMEIVAALPLSQPACSRHINDLRKAGLLESRAHGNHVFFALNESAISHFCQAMNRTLHSSDSLNP